MMVVHIMRCSTVSPSLLFLQDTAGVLAMPTNGGDNQDDSYDQVKLHCLNTEVVSDNVVVLFLSAEEIQST